MLNELMAQAVSSWGACGGFQGKVNTVVLAGYLSSLRLWRENYFIKMSKQEASSSAELSRLGVVGAGSGHSQSPGGPKTSISLLM